MNLQEKALIRKQIGEMVELNRELRRDLYEVTKELDKVTQLLSHPQWARHKKLKQLHQVYTQNEQVIQETLKVSEETIHQLRLKDKPRAYFQITQKLV